MKFEDEVNSNLVPFAKASTAEEHFNIGVGESMLRFHSLGTFFGKTLPRYRRNSDLKELIDNGQIDRKTLDRHTFKVGLGTVVDYSRLAQDPEVRKFRIPSNEMMQEEMRNEVKQMLSYSDSVRARNTSSVNTASEFAGGFVGLGADPVNFLPLAGGIKAASKTIGLFQAVKQGAIHSAGAGALGQAIQEPFVHHWNEYVGVDYSVEESLLNIGLAGLFTGTLGGFAGAISRSFKKAKLSPLLKEAGLNDKEVDAAFVKVERMQKEIEEADAMTPETLDMPAKDELIVPERNPELEAEFEASMKQYKVDHGITDVIPSLEKKDIKPKRDPVEEVVTRLEEEQDNLNKAPKKVTKAKIEEEPKPDPIVKKEDDTRLTPDEETDLQELSPEAKIVTGFDENGEAIIESAKNHLLKKEQERKKAEYVLRCIMNGK